MEYFLDNIFFNEFSSESSARITVFSSGNYISSLSNLQFDQNEQIHIDLSLENFNFFHSTKYSYPVYFTTVKV